MGALLRIFERPASPFGDIDDATGNLYCSYVLPCGEQEDLVRHFPELIVYIDKAAPLFSDAESSQLRWCVQSMQSSEHSR